MYIKIRQLLVVINASYKAAAALAVQRRAFVSHKKSQTASFLIVNLLPRNPIRVRQNLTTALYQRSARI